MRSDGIKFQINFAFAQLMVANFQCFIVILTWNGVCVVVGLMIFTFLFNLCSVFRAYLAFTPNSGLVFYV